MALKMTHIDIAILNSHVTVMCLRLIKHTSSYDEIEKLGIAAFLPTTYVVTFLKSLYIRCGSFQARRSLVN